VTKDSQALVFVVDDDEAVRSSTKLLLKSVGLPAVTYASAQEFLDNYDPMQPGCVVLDVRMPLMSGLELQQLLNIRGAIIPVIFITGHGDIPMTVRAMKGGAADFLTKPFRDQELLDAVVAAIERDRKRREVEKTVANLQSLFEGLSPRERDVLGLVADGLMNKQIAAELGLAEITVKIYRGHVMKKMGARSLADLIRMTETLGIRRAKPSGVQT
jgi:FixJ family two-component response regulator